MNALARLGHEGIASIVVVDVLREQRDVLLDIGGAALVARLKPCDARVLRELRAEGPDLDDEQPVDRRADAQQDGSARWLPAIVARRQRRAAPAPRSAASRTIDCACIAMSSLPGLSPGLANVHPALARHLGQLRRTACGLDDRNFPRQAARARILLVMPRVRRHRRQARRLFAWIALRALSPK